MSSISFQSTMHGITSSNPSLKALSNIAKQFEHSPFFSRTNTLNRSQMMAPNAASNSFITARTVAALLPRDLENSKKNAGYIMDDESFPTVSSNPEHKPFSCQKLLKTDRKYPELGIQLFERVKRIRDFFTQVTYVCVFNRNAVLGQGASKKGMMGRIINTATRQIKLAARLKNIIPHTAKPFTKEQIEILTNRRNGITKEVSLQRFLASKIPGIVEIYIYNPYIDCKQIGRSEIYAELCDSSLDVALKTGMAFKDRLSVVVQIAMTLHAVHDEYYAHNDITLSNILLQNGIPKLTDFGISRREGEVGICNPKMLAPEQKCEDECRESKKLADVVYAAATKASDVYQFGCLLESVFADAPSEEIRGVILSAKNALPAKRPSMFQTKELLADLLKRV